MMLNSQSLFYRFLLSTVLVFCFCNLNAQDTYRVFGKVDVEYGSSLGVHINVLKDAQSHSKIDLDKSGKFNIKLDFDHEYILEFSKKSYVTKRISISTYVPAEILSGDPQFPPFKFMLSLFPKYEGLDLSVFDQPMGLIMYDKELDDFDFDRDYDSQIRDAIKKAEAEAAKRAAEMQAQIIARDKAYKQAIKIADINFKAEKYTEAKDKYYEAIKINDSEEYPSIQVKKIDKLLAAISLANKNKAENDKKYSAFIKLGDDAFIVDDFVSAKASYLSSLDVYKTENYPKEQLQKIESEIKLRLQAKALAEANKEKYLLVIKRADEYFKIQEYQKAHIEYKKASLLNSQKYPLDQISKIQNIWDEQKKIKDQKDSIDLLYKELIRTADQTYKQKEFLTALSKFKEAQKLKKDEQYPKDKIIEIEQIISEQKNNSILVQERKDKFDNIIKISDNLYNKEEYQLSKESYLSALDLFAKDKYVLSQIRLIDQKLMNLASLLRKDEANNQKYKLAMDKGEQFLSSKKYKTALNWYNNALSLKADSKLAQSQIQHIKSIIGKLLQDKEAGELLAVKKAEYEKLIKAGNSFYKKKLYSQALLSFSKALELNPSELYPSEKIIAINEILKSKKDSKLQQVELKKQYDSFILKADVLFGDEEYNSAKTYYSQARQLFKSKSYPKEQIALIDKNLADIELLNQKNISIEKAYDFAMQEAIIAFDLGQLSQAKGKFKRALSIKTDDAEAKKRIAEIDLIFKDRKQEEEDLRNKKKKALADSLNLKNEIEYDKLISKADIAFSAKEYGIARVFYNKAIYLIEKEYPKSQLLDIDILMGDAKNSKLIKEYNVFITIADQSMEKGDLGIAKYNYIKARNISTDTYPVEKIQEIAQIIIDRKQDNLNSKYKENIKRADKAFNDSNYTIARFYYKSALSLKSKDEYAKSKLEEIIKLLKK